MRRVLWAMKLLNREKKLYIFFVYIYFELISDGHFKWFIAVEKKKGSGKIRFQTLAIAGERDTAFNYIGWWFCASRDRDRTNEIRSSSLVFWLSCKKRSFSESVIVRRFLSPGDLDVWIWCVVLVATRRLSENNRSLFYTSSFPLKYSYGN